MLMQNKNYLLAILLCAGIFVGGMMLQNWLWPNKKPAPGATEKQAASAPATEAKPKGESTKPPEQPAPSPSEKAVAAATGALAGGSVPLPLPSLPHKSVVLGDESGNASFMLVTQGAGVQSATLWKFQKADRMGKPVWSPDDPKKPVPLELIQKERNQGSPSFALYAFPPNFNPTNPDDDRPLDTLGRINWELVEPANPEPGKTYSKAVFRAVVDGVEIIKTYTYDPTTYHLGLEVSLLRLPTSKEGKLEFRYQLAGSHGMPLEGEWYTNTFRNALIGRVNDSDDLFRDFQDIRVISPRAGGNRVTSDDQKKIRYAGVVTQFFASVIAVDNDQDGRDLDFIKSARPTMERNTLKGKVVAVSPDFHSFKVDSWERDILVPPGAWNNFQIAPQVGAQIGVVYRTDAHDELVAIDVLPADLAHPPFLDDITVRINTVPIDLNVGEKVTHKYVLYHGPVKVRLLSHLDGGGVSEDLVDRYLYKLHLNTLTDYHFQSEGTLGWFGENVSQRIYLTNLLISTTNVMHAILTFLHRLWPYGGGLNYGVCIVLLTILVRSLMFPLSRKQALMSIRMQELQPEIAKLKEKYKDDRQALGMAQMELFRKHKVSPLGTCWVAFLQMPIFLGLYYALQESIHFRLAHFLWIDNLAAPDMLFSWTERIPFISNPASYGNFYYLGPFFNLLPVVAVALMIAQQSLMAPPAVDDQQKMQQKMMKYMMIFFGLMFYKVAAGLCIYFIASSAWGFAERKLLPKKKKDGAVPATEQKPGILQKTLGRLDLFKKNGGPDSTAITATPGRSSSNDASFTARGKKKIRGKRKGASDSPAGNGPWSKLKDWWAELLKQAEKK
jgi:YidC/Oxa1 family membrane protein insertase